ncbi:MAG: ornithine cyclodeaminase family protein [Saprospiraceae bacterium]|nr:ornithine cyclodeaminase family protein [Saprospiraceae bacterium]
MLLISDYHLHRLLDFPSLILALEEGFRSDIVTPQRHHHAFGEDATFLLMPAWQEGGYLGCKLITVKPLNRGSGLPSIQGLYLLFNAETGEPIAQMDGPVLTNYRTAAASALAADYLAPKQAETLLMVGTGSLAPFLIRAHQSVRQYRQILIWGRQFEKSMLLAENMSSEMNLKVEALQDLRLAVEMADVITVATLSENPLIQGEWLKPGQHIDLVGSYKPHMREADSLAIERSKVFIDTWHALEETGDLRIPMEEGVLSKQSISGTLIDLCKKEVTARKSEGEITLFKSVGHASEDLIASVLAYQKYGSIY